MQLEAIRFLYHVSGSVALLKHIGASLDARQDIANVEVPKLGKITAVHAIGEWG